MTSYTYDANGNQLTVTDPDLNVTTYTYNAANQQIGEVLPAASVMGGSPVSGVVSSAYDANGNLVSRVNADGLKTSWLYDNLDRQTKEIQYRSGNGYINDNITSTYDLGGRLASVSDASSTTTYTYDQLNRIATETITRAGMVGNVVLYHRYDANSNTTFTYMTVNGVYDLFNYYTYNAENMVVSQQQFDLADGQAAGLVPFISGTPAANTVAQKRVNYSYDSNGNRTAMNSYSDLAGTQLVATTTYTYNALNTLTGMVASVNTGSGPVTQTFGYTYDVGGRLTQQVTPDGTSNFTYDHDNQLLTDSQGSGSYTYDSNGNRTSVNGATATVGAGNQMATSNGYTYEYDQSGNLTLQTSSGLSNFYSWDNLNRLSGVNMNQGLNSAYVGCYYDSQNRLIWRYTYTSTFTRTSTGISFTVTQANQAYIWDGGNLLAVLNVAAGGAATVGQRFMTGTGQNQILAQENASATGAAGQTLWAVTDNNGSVVDVVGNNGSGNAILDHIVYDSFGNTTSQSNSAFAMLMGFDGYIQDSVTGLYYANARFYSSQMGRFINQDPSGFSAGDSNLYRFVGNHPTYATDPTGLFEGGNASGTSGIPTVTTYGSGTLDALVGGASYGGSLGSSQQTVFADAGLGGAITAPTAGAISPGLYAGNGGLGGLGGYTLPSGMSVGQAMGLGSGGALASAGSLLGGGGYGGMGMSSSNNGIATFSEINAASAGAYQAYLNSAKSAMAYLNFSNTSPVYSDPSQGLVLGAKPSLIPLGNNLPGNMGLLQPALGNPNYPDSLEQALVRSGTVPDPSQWEPQLEEMFAPSPVWTRLGGGLEAIGGLGESIAGVVMLAGGTVSEAGSLGTSTPISVPAAVVGSLWTANGADNLGAGMHALFYGSPSPTVTATVVTAITGSPAAGAWTNVGISLSSGVPGLYNVFAKAGELPNTIGAAGSETAAQIAAPTGDTYSVAFQTELRTSSYPGVLRPAHFQEANENLLQMMESDPQFAQQMQEAGVNLQRTPTGLAPRTSPVGWTWHHAQEPGVLQLVPRWQHTPGSLFWETLHLGGQGGYAIWGQQ